MRRIFQVAILIFFAELFGNYSSQMEPRTLTATDSLWLNFATAMDNKNIDFLLANSLDSISCVDCEPNNSGSDKQNYKVNYLFGKKSLTKPLIHITISTSTTT